ncbi:hypothetical protein KA012_03670, partial [Candidatus Woesebacteria bacterium]|nr:hypothetical protein [Candidatus Woesebacteria bacterium]
MKQPTSKNKLVRLLTGNQFLWSAVFSIPILLFLLLAFKQPYSGRSLIGNFDPFPDSFYYVVSPLRLLSTGKYEIATRYGVAKQSVPPLYGMALLPGYVLNPDPRTYYFTNVLLGIGSIALLGLIVKKTTKSAPLSLFGMLMYTLQ